MRRASGQIVFTAFNPEGPSHRTRKMRAAPAAAENEPSSALRRIASPVGATAFAIPRERPSPPHDTPPPFHRPHGHYTPGVPPREFRQAEQIDVANDVFTISREFARRFAIRRTPHGHGSAPGMLPAFAAAHGRSRA